MESLLPGQTRAVAHDYSMIRSGMRNAIAMPVKVEKAYTVSL